MTFFFSEKGYGYGYEYEFGFGFGYEIPHGSPYVAHVALMCNILLETERKL